MKKFFGEFKKFITRGNVLDMAVGVIVGGAFTGIVNGLSNYILKPIINWLLSLVLGKNGLEGAVTFLSEAYTKDANGNQIIDLANSIYIDWGAFISSIINFLLVAFVLFMIVRTINKVHKNGNEFMNDMKKEIPNRQDRKTMKAQGVSRRNREAVKKFMEEKNARLAKEAEEAKLDAERKAKEERLKNPTDNDLLKQIKELLEKKI